MKNKKINILKLSLLVIVTLTIILPNFAYADVKFSDAVDFINRGKAQAGINGLNQGDLNKVGKEFVEIAKILRYIGAGMLVALTGYMGIKYMTAPPEQQGKLKQQLIGLLVSAIVIFGAYFIWSNVYDLLNNSFNVPSSSSQTSDSEGED